MKNQSCVADAFWERFWNVLGGSWAIPVLRLEPLRRPFSIKIRKKASKKASENFAPGPKAAGEACWHSVPHPILHAHHLALHISPAFNLPALPLALNLHALYLAFNFLALYLLGFHLLAFYLLGFHLLAIYPFVIVCNLFLCRIIF